MKIIKMNGGEEKRRGCVVVGKQIAAPGGMGGSRTRVGEGLCIDERGVGGAAPPLAGSRKTKRHVSEPFPSMCLRCPRLFTISFSPLSVKEACGSALRHPTSSV